MPTIPEPSALEAETGIAAQSPDTTVREPHSTNGRSNLAIASIAGEPRLLVGAAPSGGKALAIWSHALGPNNIRVAFVTHNIGTIHAEHGRYTKALEFYRNSLGIRTRLFGDKHQYTLRVTGDGQRDALKQQRSAVEPGRTQLRALNRKFGAIDSNFDAIETVYGMGYRWIAD